MRKFRRAVLVAALVGSISVFGAGAASAHGSDGDTEHGTNGVECNQNAVTFQNINGPRTGSGPAIATSPQLNCSGRDSFGTNGAVAQSGAATGGGGTTPPPSGELTTFQVEGPLVAAGGGTDVTSTSTATCPAGSVVTGGGFVFVEDPEGDLDFFIMGNQRGPGDSWQVTVLASDSVFFRAVAECATLS